MVSLFVFAVGVFGGLFLQAKFNVLNVDSVKKV